MNYRDKIIVLNYLGPIYWNSHADTLPSLLGIFNHLNLKVLSLFHPLGFQDQEKLKMILDADLIIFPIGANYNQAPFTLKKLKKMGWKGKSIIMWNGEGLAKFQNFSRYLDIFTKEDHFIFNSHPEKKIFDITFSKQFPSTVIPLPIDEKTFSAQQSEKSFPSSLMNLGVQDQEKLMIYVGRVSAQKNLISLLALFKKFSLLSSSKWKLLIVGSYDEIGIPYKDVNNDSFINEINSWINFLQLGETVRFLPHQSSFELSQLLQICKIFISTTLHCAEDYGLAVAQSLSMGIPTLITNWGGGVDFIKKSKAIEIPTIYTPNGIKIDFETSLQQLLILENALLGKSSFDSHPDLSFQKTPFSWNNIQKMWKNTIEEILRNECTNETELDRTKLEIEKDFFKFFATNYGAIDISECHHCKFFDNPLFIKDKNHLFDPLSFQRNLPQYADPLFYGTQLPKLGISKKIL